MELELLEADVELLDDVELPNEPELLLDVDEELLAPAGLPPHPTIQIAMSRASGIKRLDFIGLAWLLLIFDPTNSSEDGGGLKRPGWQNVVTAGNNHEDLYQRNE